MSGFGIPKNRTYDEKHEMMMNFNRAEILSRLRSSDESIQQVYQQNDCDEKIVSLIGLM